MEYNEREQYIYNLIGGVVYCNFGDKVHLIHESLPLDKMIGNQIYEDRLKEAELRGVLSEEELVEQLMGIGLWSISEQTELDALPKRIENMKLQLYQAYFHYKERDPIRKNLRRLKDKFTELTIKRGGLNRESAEGLAMTSKNKYLICSNITDEYNNRLWDAKDYWKQPAKLIESLVREYAEFTMDEETVRELARTEPWRSIWGVSKIEHSLFDLPAIMFTPSQKGLVTWSRIYDNVYESTECPPEEVLEENDMLDGWFIQQSRKRDEDRKKKHGFGEDKNVKGDEVFLFADRPEDIERIQSRNTATGQAIFKQRMDIVKKKGAVDVTQLPDSQLAMRQQAAQQMKSHGRQ